MEQEVTLTGGRTTAGVVRVGNTVRRPTKARAEFAHELLRHLETRGFDDAPKFLGIDGAGRETLSFIPGYVPPELGHFTGTQLMAAARLLRRLHDATLDCALRDGQEIVCHGDASPCNCVLVDGMPTAFIDFDEAHPGTRLEDLGYAAWLWLDIGNDDLAADHQGERLAGFFRGYGLGIEGAVPAIISAQAALAERARSADVREWSNDCRLWVDRNRAKLSAAVAGRYVT